MERISQLLYKHLSNTLSEAEYEELMVWAKAHPDNKRLLDQVNNGNKLGADLEDWFAIPEKVLADDSRLETEITRHERRIKVRQIRRWIPYAAAVVVVLTVGVWILNSRRQTSETRHQPLEEVVASDIAPGTNRATLTLGDGRSIDLSETKTGIVVGDGISYSDGSGLLEPGRSEKKNSLSETLPPMSISTPEGGTYQVALSDGTKVWLNSASTLKCPQRFGGKERVVEISGEAYFAVAPDAQKLFKVISNGQEIQVLGTEFNISAYQDEPEIKTTLVSGAVLIVNRQSSIRNKLRPGQQSTVRGEASDVQWVDTEPYISWKSGYFCFRHTPFSEVMRQLARWYNMDIVYKGNIPGETFSGGIDRDLTLGAVLKLLNVSAVKVKIAPGNKLIVY